MIILEASLNKSQRNTLAQLGKYVILTTVGSLITEYASITNIPKTTNTMKHGTAYSE